ncbi:MAG: hypothetical protein ACI93R_001010 [Flavobacteriales bacterium]
MAFAITAITAITAIAVRLVVGFGLSHFMVSRGYSACWELSSPSIMSPTFWVKDTRYCIENSGSVREEVLSWIGSQESTNHDISFNDVKDKTAALLKVFDQQQREKYPELY